MTKEEKIRVEEECNIYLEELDKDPISGPNCFNADDLTLGVMFRRHPSLVHQINPEVIDRVKNNEMYSVFRENVLKKAREERWTGVTSLEEEKIKGFVTEKDLERIRDNNRMRHTGGITKEEYQKAADELIRVWYDYLDYLDKKINMK